MAIDAPFERPAAVEITMPSTSPIAQPVRQWTVALNATRFSAAAAARVSPCAGASECSIAPPTLPAAATPPDALQPLHARRTVVRAHFLGQYAAMRLRGAGVTVPTHK